VSVHGRRQSIPPIHILQKQNIHYRGVDAASGGAVVVCDQLGRVLRHPFEQLDGDEVDAQRTGGLLLRTAPQQRLHIGGWRQRQRLEHPQLGRSVADCQRQLVPAGQHPAHQLLQKRPMLSGQQPIHYLRGHHRRQLQSQ